MAMTRAERSKINKANWAKKSRSQGRGSSSSALPGTRHEMPGTNVDRYGRDSYEQKVARMWNVDPKTGSSRASVRLPSGRKMTLPSGLKQWFCSDVMLEGDECFACFSTPAEAIKHGDRVVFTEWSETNPAPLSHCR